MSYYYKDLGYADYGSDEPEPNWDTFKQAEIEYTDQGGYLQEEEYHSHHLAEPEYQGNNTYEHRTLEYDDDVHAFTPADHDAAEPLTPSNTTHGPAHLIPMYIPSYPFHSTPAPIPHLYDFHNANQQGHVTTPNHVQDTCELAHANYNACIGYNTAEPNYYNNGATCGNDRTPIDWETGPMGLKYRDKTHERKPNWEAFKRASMEYGDNGGYLREETHEHGTLEHDAHVPTPTNHHTSTSANDPDEWHNELGMDTEVYKPWEFEDCPTTSLHDCIKPTVLRAAREGNQ